MQIIIIEMNSIKHLKYFTLCNDLQLYVILFASLLKKGHVLGIC